MDVMDLALSRTLLDMIVARMRQLRLSQKEVGVLLGLGQERVSDKLGGRRYFTREEAALLGTMLMLPEIVKAAGITPKDFSAKTWELIARAVVKHLQRMRPHDRCEALFGMALALEGKRPYGESPETKLLRALAALTPVVIPTHPFADNPRAAKARRAVKTRAARAQTIEPQLV